MYIVHRGWLRRGGGSILHAGSVYLKKVAAKGDSPKSVDK